ncbi:MAG: hypothetical protein ACOYI4_00750 [Christensenellales bacterium]|jgi:hypothetical protein
MNKSENKPQEKTPTIMSSCGYPLKNYPLEAKQDGQDCAAQKAPSKARKAFRLPKRAHSKPFRPGPILIISGIIALFAVLIFLIYPLLSPDRVTLEVYRQISPGLTTLQEVQALCNTQQASPADYSISTIPADGVWFAARQLTAKGAPTRLIGVKSQGNLVQEVVYIDEAVRQSGTATHTVDESMIVKGANYDQVLALVQMPVVVASAYDGEWAYCYGWNAEAATFACLAVFDENDQLTHFENNEDLLQQGAEGSPSPAPS